ncbi:MAG: polysaccharide biosynthesis protein [Rhizobacter sp.]|nr:polysaccharide biosynthesis protein [Rhizobacter sp.]
MLIRATLKYLPAQVLAPLAQLLSMVVWTHWLEPVEMGAFTLLTTTQELVYLVGLSWFSVHALRSLPGAERTGAAWQRFLHTENAVVAGACVAMTVFGVVFTQCLADMPMGWHDAFWVAMFFVTRSLNAHYAERARAQSSYAAYTVLQSIGPIGGLALGVIGLQLFAPSATVLFASYAIANAAATVFALPRLGIARQWRRPDARVMRAAFAFGGPMLVISALGWVAENHLRYLVQWQAGAVALGLMAVGFNLGRRAASVAAMLVTTAGFPIASRLLNDGRRAEAIAQLKVNAAMLMAVSLPVCAALVFIGPALIAFAVAPAYQETTSAVFALSVISGTVRNLQVHICDQWLILERRFKVAAALDIFETAVCAVASVIGLWFWGLHGAVAGQLVGSVLNLGVSVWWIGRRMDFDWPVVDTVKVSISTLLASGAVWCVGISADVCGAMTAVLVGALTYAVAMSAAYRESIVFRLGRSKAPTTVA